MDWRKINGYDWCVLDTRDAPFIGLTLGYGLIHEPVQQFGTLQLLAGMLQAELSRPIEIAPGAVAVPEVSVNVHTDTLDIGIRGDHSTVLSTWQRLMETFAGEHPLDSAPPVGVHLSAAARDLTSRFGMTSLTLAAAATLELQIDHDPIALLRQLDPAAGRVRAVVCTNSEQLVGTGLIPLMSPPAAQPEPSRYRATAGSGGMQFPGGQAIISTVVPRTGNGAAAIRVLAQQTAYYLGTLTQRDDGVITSLIPVGPEVLATVVTHEFTPTPQQRSQLHQLLASRPIADYRIEQAVEWEFEHQPLSRILERRVHALPDDEPPSIAGTQQALAAARRTLRFFTEEASTTPVGFDEIPPELPSPQGPSFDSKPGVRERLTIGSEVIEHYRRPPRSPEENDRVDLTRLELVIEDPTDCVALIDDEFRVVEIVFDIYSNEQQLRELIATKTTGVPRLTARNAVVAGPPRQRITNRRTTLRWSVLTPLVVGSAIVASSLASCAFSGEPEPELELETHPHTIEAAVGETAATPSGAEVTLHDIAQRPVDLGTEFTVAIEYCAAEEREFLSTSSFDMVYGDYAQRATPIDASDEPFESAQLDAGQCATGNLGFFVPEEAPSQVEVEFRAGDLSSITWRLESN